ncbi:hypothetical protein D0863_14435 [Hortaea werneckii]|uniref:Pentacotripeptide-repeat region of PRORP domain-containing protein n=1 Tax=Hortaea werneckii TaxID=91943 RepID=A0A3M7CII2_HORWE|nr:hypothetical protein D0863_14435 [Hortaea werneckii]
MASRRPSLKQEDWDIPESLQQRVNALVRCGPSGEHDIEAWRIVQDIISHESSENVSKLGLHRMFSKTYMGLSERLTKQAVHFTPEEQKAKGLPSPTLLVQLLHTFQLEAQDFYPRMLWLVSSAALETPKLSLRRQLLDDAMLIWNMAFASRLIRHRQLINHPSRPPLAVEGLNWSFLPDISTLREQLTSRLAAAPSMSFSAALSMYLPALRSNNTYSKLTQTKFFYDWPSPALVTLDLLRTTPPAHAVAGRETIPYVKQAEYAPFVELVEGLLVTLKKPGVGMAMRGKFDDERTKGIYLGLAHRLGLNLPPWLREGGSGVAPPLPAKKAVKESTERQRKDNVAIPDDEGATSSVASQESKAWAETVRKLGESAQGKIQQQSETSTPLQAEDADRQEEQSTSTAPLNPSSDESPTVQESPDVLAPPPLALKTPLTSRDKVTARFIDLRMNRLGQAQQKQQPRLAEHIKDEIFAFAASPEKPRLPDELFEHLMLALMSLARPKHAIEVWNHFIQSGRQPTAKTYTVMMRGAQHARDVSAMEGFWQKMRMAGVQPDVSAWSTRIYGLIKGNKVKTGMRALAEMKDEWIAAARRKRFGGGSSSNASQEASGGRGRQHQTPPEISAAEATSIFEGDVDDVPRPNVVVMNAAISALAAKNDRLISEVLQWGRTFGLEPDRRTYNVLLNVSMRHGQSDEAIDILRRMNQKNVQVDSQTWTVILTELFHDEAMNDLSHAEQEDKVLSLITSLESVSTSPSNDNPETAQPTAFIDQKGYALVIDRLLKLYNNVPAANAVLSHMLNRNMQPTTQIYTILMAHYFQMTPYPDFAAVEALWHRIRAAEEDAGGRLTLDGVFYDRMIEAYATYHSLLNSSRPMMEFYYRLVASGRRPSWRALEHLARCLAERGEWDLLVQVVDQAREWVVSEDAGAGGAEVGMRPRVFGQRGFWEFVRETGVLRHEEVV